jgi:hypothetical protein
VVMNDFYGLPISERRPFPPIVFDSTLLI